MIQRVQSIFLALAAIAIFAMIFSPMWGKADAENTQLVVLNASTLTHTKGAEVVETTNTIYLTILAFISAAVAIGSLFSYKNRMTQIKLNLLNSFLLLATVVLIALNLYSAQKVFDPTNPGAFKIGFFLPIVALFFNSLANRFIRKDEKLVKSVDRLR
ncbi:MAG: DUF4293 domain-containing protein [Flammeovirgaceae bacterium]